MPEAQPSSQDASNQKKIKYKDALIFTGIILLAITLFTLAAIYNIDIDIDNSFSLLFGYIIIGTLTLPLIILIAMAILRGISLLIGQ